MIRRIFVTALIVVGVIAAPAKAFAAGESGVLITHGPVGSSFAGPGALVSAVTGVGGSASFTAKVQNIGSSLSQFNLRLTVRPGCNFTDCAQPPAAATLSAGSLLVTPLSAGPNGYYTAPIAANQTATYTLKLTAPATALAGYADVAELDLYDTSGNFLSYDLYQLNITDTTGSAANDVYANLAGHSAIIGNSVNIARQVILSGPQTAVGTANSFTVKVKNDSTTAADVSGMLVNINGCPQYQATVKQGTTDISAAIVNPTKFTSNVADLGTLAPGKSITLSIAITPASDPRPCLGANFEAWAFGALAAASPSQVVYLGLNPQQP